MSSISAKDISRAQAQFLGLLTTPCTVTRNEGTPTPVRGGYTQPSVQTYAGTCLVGQGKPTPIVTIGGAVQSVTNTTISFPAGADVQAGDTVSVLGTTYTVQGSFTDGPFEVLHTVSVRQQQAGA